MKVWDKIKLFFGLRRTMRRAMSRIINENSVRIDTDELESRLKDINKLDIDFQAYCEASNLDFKKEIAEAMPELFVQPEESEMEKKISEMLQKSREDVLVKVYRSKNQRPENNSTPER